MTKEGYREMLLTAMSRHDDGDTKLLDLIAEVLEEQDRAKHILREKGYGCTGMGIAETAEEVPLQFRINQLEDLERDAMTRITELESKVQIR